MNLNRKEVQMPNELLKCSFCHDPLTTDDNDSNLCGACADGLKAEKDRLLKENANLNDWLKTWKESFDLAQTEIAKLKQPIICAKCNDHIVANDGAICEVCAYTQESAITELQGDIEELEKVAIVWHKYPDEKPDMDVKCLVMFDDGEPIISSFDGFNWWDIEKAWVGRITHWAYLSAPPKEGE